MTPTAVSQELSGWYPLRLAPDGEVSCSWLYAGDVPFTAPFFYDSIVDCQRITRSSGLSRFKSWSPITSVCDWAEAIDHVNPTAFIFHTSRCGSTLLSQMLACNQENIVLSEVPFFNEVLMNAAKLADQTGLTAESLFRSAISFYGQKRTGKEKYLFIKTDCWHVLFGRQLRQMYPDVPFIFLYRRPDDILRSQQRSRGIQAIPGLIDPEFYGFDPAVAALARLDEYMLMVLERLYQKFIEICSDDPHSLLMNYSEGPERILGRAIDYCRLTDMELGVMTERAKHHSKKPEEVFVGDAAGFMLDEKLLDRAFRLYESLEELRTLKNEKTH